ncbi:MAG: phosphoglucomutase [Proteobacteria bacterium]|nr:phosphoglucomutase [Pseudomonadota bacterium]
MEEKHMVTSKNSVELFGRFIVSGDHFRSDYIGLIKEIVARKKNEGQVWHEPLAAAYQLLFKEIRDNHRAPAEVISFGTSGWRGKLGKDINACSTALVTSAIVQMYENLQTDPSLKGPLGVESLAEAQVRGCVLGFDNRFAGPLLAASVAYVLAYKGFRVHYAGESTTGVLSAAVLKHKAAFSINLTPSHNPLEYGGYKFNAADAGPAASEVTETITANALKLVEQAYVPDKAPETIEEVMRTFSHVQSFDSLATWKYLVQENQPVHGLDLDRAVAAFLNRDDMVVVIDCVHGASRLHVRELFDNTQTPALIVLRDTADVTFGGVAPEPSTANMRNIVETLQKSTATMKLGAIIDPDGDRIRFTDGTSEITMNHFGAMAYHFLHEYKGKAGMVAKTVATSNLANGIAAAFGEELFEPSVGFKNFKPVIGRALVFFEESDGISIIGHTPEKDAYIGLLLALEMMLTTNMNLGDYLKSIEDAYGAYYPERDGVAVSVKGEELLRLLAKLAKYHEGSVIKVGDAARRISKVITIDGQKMVFEDGSWLMIRPSGTEPKVRFYVESRTPSGTNDLVSTAKNMLVEIGIL